MIHEVDDVPLAAGEEIASRRSHFTGAPCIMCYDYSYGKMNTSTVRFDRHARRRMKWRRITEEEVYLALKNPDRLEKSIRGRVNVYKLVGGRYIKVTYKELPGETLVISAVDKGKGDT